MHSGLWGIQRQTMAMRLVRELHHVPPRRHKQQNNKSAVSMRQERHSPPQPLSALSSPLPHSSFPSPPPSAQADKRLKDPVEGGGRNPAPRVFDRDGLWAGRNRKTGA